MPVERPTFHESWYRVAEIHPRLSSTVQISRQHFRGMPWHVVQDHTNNAFFRLAEPAYRFIGLLDGKRTVGDAWKVTNEQLGDEAPTQGEVIQLLGQLYTANLLQADVPADTHTLFSRYKQRKQREITSYLMNIMFARIPVFDPDAFLNKWLWAVGWIFSPVGFFVWMVLLALGVHSVMQMPHWQTEITSRSSSLLDPSNIIPLYIAFACIKACHEMGHAISCKKFGKQSGTGGEVHIIGIMFLVFTPVPYVDASSSWALRNKFHRAIVGAAGMWVELAIASVAAMVWAGTTESVWQHGFAYNIMFVAGFSTVVFNANPLLRYDGYYILSDLLEIPNLATRSKEYIFYLVKKYAWNVRHPRNPAHTPAEKFWLAVYAVASFFMRCVVTFSIMFYLTGVLNGNLIILATAMAIAGLLTWLFVPIGKFIHYLSTSPELGRSRGQAFLTSGLVIAAAVVGLGFVPVPDRARAQGVVEPDPSEGKLSDMQLVVPGGDGEVLLYNRAGDPPGDDGMAKRLGLPTVKTGEMVLKVDDQEKLSRLKTAESSLSVALANLNRIRAENPPQLAGAEVVVIGAQREVALLRKEVNDLDYKSPIDGVLYMQPGEERRHTFVRQSQRSDQLGEIVNLHHLIVRAAAANELSGQLLNEEEKNAQGKIEVEIRVIGRPDVLIKGDVYQQDTGKRDLPSPALGYQVGGMINTATDDRNGTRAVDNFFEVRIERLRVAGAKGKPDVLVDQSDLLILPGQRVVVRFTFAKKPLAVQLWRGLRQVFQKKFQAF